MLSELIKEIDTHLAWRKAQGQPLAETTLGRLAANDGKLVGRLRSGAGLTVATMQGVQGWLARDRAEVSAITRSQDAA